VLLAVSAAPAAAQEPIAELRGQLERLQDDDTRLHSIGWRLAEGNARFCPDPQPLVGLLPLDVRSFKRPDEIRAALGIGGEFAVQAVAKGSPAAFARLKPGEELLAIDGDALRSLPEVKPGSYSRLAALQTRIERALAARGELGLSLRKDGAIRQLVLKGKPVCRSRFELLTGGNEAAADGERVTISRQYLSLARSDDEVAFLLGHELAHNILRHRAWLDKVGRENANNRIAERAADRLAVWLMANAGYDVTQAPAFMEHWGRRQGSGLFREASHDHWKARQKAVNLELVKIAEARALLPGAPLDWREHFPR
jgi:hypothetical protein